MKTVYVDNNATTQVAPEVLEAMSLTSVNYMVTPPACIFSEGR